MLYLAWRNVTRRMGRSLVTVAIIALTTLVLVMSSVALISFQSALDLSRSRLGADVMVLPSGASSDASEVLFTAQPVNVYLPQDALDAVHGVAGVEAATPQFFTQTVNQSCCSVVGINRVVGIDTESDFVVTPWLADGGMIELAADQVLVGASAPELTGGQASILGSTFHVAGTLEETGTSVDETIFMDIESARTIAANSPYLTSVWEGVDPYTSISCVMVKVTEGADVAAVIKGITESYPGVVAIASSDVIGDVSSQFSVMGGVCVLFIVVIALLAALALGGRFSALVSGRAKELGLMRSMGVGKTGVAGSVLVETGLMTLVGVAAGCVAGCIAAGFVVDAMHTQLSLPGMVPDVAVYAGAIGVGVVFAVLLDAVSLVLPLSRILRHDPQETLSRGDL